MFFVALAVSWVAWSLTEIPERLGRRRANLIAMVIAAVAIGASIVESLDWTSQAWFGGVIGVCLGSMFAFRGAAVRAKKAEARRGVT